ncbi:hypothetical protein ACLOJK_023074 [Asimina triloba]
MLPSSNVHTLNQTAPPELKRRSSVHRRSTRVQCFIASIIITRDGSHGCYPMTPLVIVRLNNRIRLKERWHSSPPDSASFINAGHVHDCLSNQRVFVITSGETINSDAPNDRSELSNSSMMRQGVPI